jgi:hypothetical protein
MPQVNKRQNSYFRSGNDIRLLEQTVFGSVNVIQQEQLPDNVNINNILKKLEIVIPQHFIQNLDGIYIGTYSFLLDRELNAQYKDGVIYVLADQDSEMDIYDDIIHEIAHCVEETYGPDIYEDGSLEEEFMRKRRRLFDSLRAYGYTDGMPEAKFMNPDFDPKFDRYLYSTVGYPVLAQLVPDLFVSPYGATSLREYFANSFEHYFAHREYKRVLNVSPSVYKKIEMLLGDN